MNRPDRAGRTRNVLDNAYTHARRGSRSIQRVGDDVALDVIDDGPGIAPADREVIFERFVRLDGDAGGSGLGLAIVRDIVDARRGNVSVEPTTAGTCIRLRLPAVSA